tara:strand:+ start:1026 stop:1265 length:240 start_codon:yes stop_codon:yes gene_type:complete
MTKRQVVKEFLGGIVKAIGKKKGKNAAKAWLSSPRMKKLAKQQDDLRKAIKKDMEREKREDPDFEDSYEEMLKFLKDLD